MLTASSSDDTIAWYENDGSESFKEHIVTTTADKVTCVVPVDLEGDSDVDILWTAANDDTLAWSENDGSQSFTTRVVTAAADGAWDAITRVLGSFDARRGVHATARRPWRPT